jgi:hypothetical protein
VTAVVAVPAAPVNVLIGNKPAAKSDCASLRPGGWCYGSKSKTVSARADVKDGATDFILKY